MCRGCLLTLVSQGSLGSVEEGVPFLLFVYSIPSCRLKPMVAH